MATLTRDMHWAETLSLIQHLWPRWQATDEQVDVWERALCRTNPELCRGCLREHYAKSRYREPSLDRVISIIRAKVASQRAPAAQVVPTHAEIIRRGWIANCPESAERLRRMSDAELLIAYNRVMADEAQARGLGYLYREQFVAEADRIEREMQKVMEPR